jgi:PMC2NT (NUC016) domain
MEQTPDFKSLQEQVQASLIATTRTAGQISSEDLAFQRSLNREVGTALDEQGNRLLDLSSQLLKSATSISDLRAPVLEEFDDVENNWRGVVDVIDSLLEKTDTCLDEYTGMIKRKEQSPADQVCHYKDSESVVLSLQTGRHQQIERNTPLLWAMPSETKTWSSRSLPSRSNRTTKTPRHGNPFSLQNPTRQYLWKKALA